VLGPIRASASIAELRTQTRLCLALCSGQRHAAGTDRIVVLQTGLDAIYRLEIDELLLKIRRQQHQVQRLRNPGSGEPELACHLELFA